VAMITDIKQSKRKVITASCPSRKSKRRKYVDYVEASSSNDDEEYVPEESDDVAEEESEDAVEDAVETKASDVEFENMLNDKIFRILSSRNEYEKSTTQNTRSFKNEKVDFKLTAPDVKSIEVKSQPEELMYAGKSLPYKIPSPSADRQKYFSSIEKITDEKYRKIREECLQSENPGKVYRRRRGKRGTLGFTLGMEIKNIRSLAKPKSNKPHSDDVSIAKKFIKCEEINEDLNVERVNPSVKSDTETPVVDVDFLINQGEVENSMDLQTSHQEEVANAIDLPTSNNAEVVNSMDLQTSTKGEIPLDLPTSNKEEDANSADLPTAQGVNPSQVLEEILSMPVFDF